MTAIWAKIKIYVAAGVLVIFIIMALALSLYRLDNARLKAEVSAKEKLITASQSIIRAQSKNIVDIKDSEKRLQAIAKASGKIVERIETLKIVPGPPGECRQVIQDEGFKNIYGSIADRFNGMPDSTGD